MSTFKKLKIHDWIIQRLNLMGVKNPTPVQIQCIPEILKGRDCIACAKTGSGKTLAFALPIIQEVSINPHGIFALVLTPSRELAFQIADQFKVLMNIMSLRVCVIVGGMDMVEQGEELAQRPHVVVATPGRLADYVRSGALISTDNIRFLVMDEADRLLQDSFTNELKVIFKILPKKRQTLLFSATITDSLKELRKVAKQEPFFWEEESDVATVNELDQRYVLTPLTFKEAYLVQVVYEFMQEKKHSSVLIFTPTCKYCQIITMMFNKLGFQCAALHSMIPQKERLTSLSKFKSSHIRILIATDVASRGLDIPVVDMIVNHNVPPVPKDYIHRVGRTARAGRGGIAVTFITPRDIHLLHAVEDLINTKLKQHEVDERKVLQILELVAVEKRKSQVELEKSDFFEKRTIYKRKQIILEGKDPEEEDRKARKAKKLKKEQLRLRYAQSLKD